MRNKAYQHNKLHCVKCNAPGKSNSWTQIEHIAVSYDWCSTIRLPVIRNDRCRYGPHSCQYQPARRIQHLKVNRCATRTLQQLQNHEIQPAYQNGLRWRLSQIHPTQTIDLTRFHVLLVKTEPLDIDPNIHHRLFRAFIVFPWNHITVPSVKP